MHGILKQTNSWESPSLPPRTVATNENIYTSLIWMGEKNIYCTLNMIYETITYSCVVSNRTIHLTDYYSSWHYSASFRSSLAKCWRLSGKARQMHRHCWPGGWELIRRLKAEVTSDPHAANYSGNQRMTANINSGCVWNIKVETNRGGIFSVSCSLSCL